jgi:hypothetical protein
VRLQSHSVFDAALRLVDDSTPTTTTFVLKPHVTLVRMPLQISTRLRRNWNLQIPQIFPDYELKIFARLHVSAFWMITILTVGSLTSAVACCLLELAIVTETNRKMQGWTSFAYLHRDIAVIFQRHRRLYPASRLRVAFVLSSCSLASCIAGLIVVHRIVNGL